MRIVFALIFISSVVSAQDKPAALSNPLMKTSAGMFAISKGDVLGSINKIPDEMWSYKPVDSVRTVGQLFAHIADGQYEFCGTAMEGKPITKDIEKTKTTKAEIVPALKEAFAYCDSVYAKLTDAQAAEIVPFFGMKVTRVGLMDFNFAHNMEHYGNLVTYMRLKGILPPSSEPRK